MNDSDRYEAMRRKAPFQAFRFFALMFFLIAALVWTADTYGCRLGPATTTTQVTRYVTENGKPVMADHATTLGVAMVIFGIGVIIGAGFYLWPDFWKE